MKKTAPPAKSADRNQLADAPAPAHPALWAAGVYALCTLALSYPALGGKFLAMPWSDQYIAGYGFREFGVESLRQGHFAQWNPYLFGGIPFISAMHGDIFYPTAFLRVLLGTGAGMSWGFALHLFLAGMFTYAFIRQWGLGFFPALIAGVAYMLSGQLAGLASPGHDGKLFVSALLPLALLMLTRGIRDGKSWAWGGLALTIALAGLSPHPQLAQYLLLTSGAFALYLAFGTHEGIGRLPRNVGIRRLALSLGSVLLGAAITAIQYYPLYKYIPWSPRAEGRGYDYATSFSQPIEELAVNSYLPQFSGIINEYWGRNGIHLHSEYLGVVVLFLAIAAIGTQGYKGFRRFWLGAFVVAVLWSLGGNTPLFHLIYSFVPGTKQFRAPSTIFFVYAFAVAIFAAFGARRLLAARVTTRYALIWTGAAAAIALLMMAGLASALARPVVQAIARERSPDNVDGYLSAWMDQFVMPNLHNVTIGGWRSFLFVGLAALLTWALVTRRIPQKVAAWALVALVAADLWSVERNYWQFSPPASTVYASDPAIDLLKSAAQPGRVMALDGEDLSGQRGLFPAQSRDPLFDGSGFMAHDVRDLTGYHGNELHRYQVMFDAGPDRAYNPGKMITPAVWRHENVQYLYTTLPDTVIPQLQAALKLSAPFTKLVGPVRDASGTTVYLYRVPGENPFAWVASGAVRANDTQALPTVIDARFDPTLAALVDTQSTIPVRELAELKPSALKATVKEYRPGAVSIDLSAPAPAGAVLVVSENYFPGWKATSGTADLPTSRANYNLIGVALAAGTQHVELSFSDPAYATGKKVTLVALLIAVVALIAGLVIDRRRAAPVASAA